jgi:hypothetical protein
MLCAPQMIQIQLRITQWPTCCNQIIEKEETKRKFLFCALKYAKHIERGGKVSLHRNGLRTIASFQCDVEMRKKADLCLSAGVEKERYEVALAQCS